MPKVYYAVSSVSPCHHVTYLFNEFGEAWECQKWVRYIASHFNGKRLRKPVITYDDIKDGADLHFVMSGKPAKKVFAE